MAFPATGMEAAYRNDGNQVANLFKEKHPGHFCIYNLTERKYDTTMFEGRVRNERLENHNFQNSNVWLPPAFLSFSKLLEVFIVHIS